MTLKNYRNTNITLYDLPLNTSYGPWHTETARPATYSSAHFPHQVLVLALSPAGASREPLPRPEGECL